MSSPLWKISAAVACLLTVLSARAEAHECGDADDSGTVTVTDGVQALRAAAGLSSVCGSSCDVDGSGSVTVTDGVNVLRKAAGLSITESCEDRDTQLQALLRQTLPLFGTLTKIGGGAQAAASNICENADGEFSFDPDFNEYDFFDCVIGGITFDGFIGVDGNTLSLDIDFTVVATEEFFSFSGELTEQVSGRNSIVAGNLDISFSELGDLSVQFENVVIDPNGNSIGGSLLFDASTSDITGVAGIRIGFTPTTVVPVAVILTDNSTLNFNFDTVSGELTPVSN